MESRALCEPQLPAECRTCREKRTGAARRLADDRGRRGNHFRLRRRIFRAVLQKVRLSVCCLPREGVGSPALGASALTLVRPIWLRITTQAPPAAINLLQRT